MRHCELCGVSVGDDGALQQHLHGKKHLMRLKKQSEHAERLASINVYPIRTAKERDDAYDYSQSFGAVAKMVHITDATLRVTFAEEETAQRISSTKHHLVSGNWRTIYRIQYGESEQMKQKVPPSLQPSELVTVEDDLLRLLHTASSVDEQLHLLVEKTALSRSDVTVRETICSELQRLLRAHTPFKDCTVNLFGSSVSGFGTRRCDMDVVLLTDGLAVDGKPAGSSGSQTGAPPADGSCLSSDADVLRTHVRRTLVSACGRTPLCITNVIPVLCARVPIIKFNVQGLNADLSINRRLGVFNSKLLSYLSDSDPRIRLVVGAVRAWGKKHRLSGMGGDSINSYSLTLLVVFYLQNCDSPLLPPVLAIKTRDCQRHHAGGGHGFHSAECWELELDDGVRCFDASHCEHQQLASSNTMSAGELLAGFFAFYQNFDFGQRVVSTRCGHQIGFDDLPSNTSSRKFGMHVMNIQDPFDELHNTAANVSPSRLSLLQAELRSACRHLQIIKPQNHGGLQWGIEALLCVAERWSKNIVFLRSTLPQVASELPAGCAGAFTKFLLHCLCDLLWFDIKIFDAPGKPEVMDSVVADLAVSGLRCSAVHDERTSRNGSPVPPPLSDQLSLTRVPPMTRLAASHAEAVAAATLDKLSSLGDRTSSGGAARVLCGSLLLATSIDSSACMAAACRDTGGAVCAVGAADSKATTLTNIGETRKRDCGGISPGEATTHDPDACHAPAPKRQICESASSAGVTSPDLVSDAQTGSSQPASFSPAAGVAADSQSSRLVDCAALPEGGSRPRVAVAAIKPMPPVDLPTTQSSCDGHFLFCECTTRNNAFDGRRKAQNRIFPHLLRLTFEDCRKLTQVMVSGERPSPEQHPIVRFHLNGFCDDGETVRFEMTRFEGAAVAQFVSFIEKFLDSMLSRFFVPDKA